MVLTPYVVGAQELCRDEELLRLRVAVHRAVGAKLGHRSSAQVVRQRSTDCLHARSLAS